MKPVARIYNKRQTAKVAAFTENFRQQAANNGVFDSASSEHHDPHSLQPNRAAASVLRGC